MPDVEADQADGLHHTAFLDRRIFRWRGVDEGVYFVKARGIVAASEYLPGGFHHDCADVGSAAAGKGDGSGEALLPGPGIKLVRQDVIEHRTVGVNLEARVGLVLVDERPGVERLGGSGEQVGSFADQGQNFLTLSICGLSSSRYVVRWPPHLRLAPPREDAHHAP